MNQTQEPQSPLPVDAMIERIDSVSPLHNLMMLSHVENKLEKNSELLEWYRRKGLNMPDKQQSGKQDDMKILSTGPVHVTQSEARPQSNGWRSAITAGLTVATLLGVPGAAAIAWLAKPDKAPIVLPGKSTPDTSVKVGLGKIGDLLPKE